MYNSTYILIINRVICIIYIAIYLIYNLEYNYAFDFILIFSYVLRLIFTKKSDSQTFVSYITIIYLFLGPSILMIMEKYGDPLLFLALTVLWFDFINHFSRTKMPHRRIYYPAISRDFGIWLALLFLASIGTPLFGKDQNSIISLFSFTVPFSISLLYFERIVYSSSLMKIYIMIAIYFIIVMIYVLYYWSGFGRLVIGTYVLMPVLIADRYRDLGLRPWHAAALAPLLLAAAHLSRYGSWGETKDLADGSSAHHLKLTIDLFRSPVYEYFGGFSRFFDQYLLLFLNWFPREAWLDKPVGLGYAAVDEWIGRQGYGRGFSVSLGMFGEQLYLLGPYFLISWFGILLTLIILRRMIVKLSFTYAAPAIVFDINLISYVWGGSATFGSRVWFFVVPLLIVLSIWRFTGRERAAPVRFLRLQQPERLGHDHRNA